jgi:hypothetical protein
MGDNSLLPFLVVFHFLSFLLFVLFVSMMTVMLDSITVITMTTLVVIVRYFCIKSNTRADRCSFRCAFTTIWQRPQ